MIQKSISIFGAGKLAWSLTQGFLNAGFSPHRINLIRRLDTSRNLSHFYEKKIKVRKSPLTAARSECIILAVTPQGAGPTLDALSKAYLSSKKRYEIISFVSGLAKKDIKSILPHSVRANVIAATCNTNIAYNKGIICATGRSVLFDHLGQFIQEEPDAIPPSIVTVGTMNALILQGILISYRLDVADVSLSTWIEGLQSVLTDIEGEKSQLRKGYKTFLSFLFILSDIISGPPLLYGQKAADERIKACVTSALDTLISFGVSVNEETIEDLIRTVVTKGGCTEKGISKLQTAEQLMDEGHIRKFVMIPIILAADKFPLIVGESIKEYFS